MFLLEIRNCWLFYHFGLLLGLVIVSKSGNGKMASAMAFMIFSDFKPKNKQQNLPQQLENSFQYIWSATRDWTSPSCLIGSREVNEF
jgi:hypothetical protein